MTHLRCPWRFSQTKQKSERNSPTQALFLRRDPLTVNSEGFKMRLYCYSSSLLSSLAATKENLTTARDNLTTARDNLTSNWTNLTAQLGMKRGMK